MKNTSHLGALLVGLLGCSGPSGGAPMAEAAGGQSSAAASACAEPPEPSTWASWPMPNPVQSGLPHAARYEPSASGHQITDEVTGLIWERYPDARAFSWEAARAHCSCSTLDGERGWRLPSRIELASLVDWTQVSPSIDALAFPNTSDENFWTSSPVTIDPGLVYLVYFQNGHTTYSASDYDYRARCVRSPGGATSPHYMVGTATVKDELTGLTWQRAVPSALYPWSEAKAYCAALELEGGGFRLPSIGELQTLVDEANNPAVDEAAFPDTPSEYFWSSSPVVDDPSRAWTAFFTNGSTYSFDLTKPRNVRCVR